MYEYFKRVIVTANNISNIYIHYWQSKGLSNEQIKPPNISASNDLAPILDHNGFRIKLKFNGSLLRQSRVTYDHEASVNIFIVYELYLHTIDDDFALSDGLFGAVKVTEKDKNNYDNYVYNCFGVCFDSKGTFTHSDGSTARNVIIFGADSSQSIHGGNKSAENLMILGKGLIQKINKQTVYADHSLMTNFTQTSKNTA